MSLHLTLHLTAEERREYHTLMLNLRVRWAREGMMLVGPVVASREGLEELRRLSSDGIEPPTTPTSGATCK